jgi:hypothetical protein
MIDSFATIAVYFFKNETLYAVFFALAVIIASLIIKKESIKYSLIAIISMVFLSPLYFAIHMSNANTEVKLKENTELPPELQRRVHDLNLRVEKHRVNNLESDDDLTEDTLLIWVDISTDKVVLIKDIRAEQAN